MAKSVNINLVERPFHPYSIHKFKATTINLFKQATSFELIIVHYQAEKRKKIKLNINPKYSLEN